jgi:regulator of chromosome condensation
MDTGGLVDMKDGDDDSDSESGLNPKESTPTEVDTTEIPSCRQVTMQV